MRSIHKALVVHAVRVAVAVGVAVGVDVGVGVTQPLQAVPHASSSAMLFHVFTELPWPT